MTLEEEVVALRAEVAVLRSYLNRCFRGQVYEVRNDIIRAKLREHTEQLLAMPKEDLVAYIKKNYE